MTFARACLFSGSAVFLTPLSTVAWAQTVLPPVTLSTPAKKAKVPQTKQVRTTASRTAAAPRAPARTVTRTVPASAAPSAAVAAQNAASEAAGAGSPSIAVDPGPVSPAVAAARVGEARSQELRRTIYTNTGANVTTLGREGVKALPQGDNTEFDRLVLQLPGVTQDSANSGDFHIRNEHANTQYRINGIQLPDGVSGFSQVLSSSFIRSISLVDGALPAEYGLHTAGVFDIVTRNGADNPGTIVTTYGGSFDTIIPTIETSGVAGGWDYFFTGRFISNGIGIENTAPTYNPIHDDTRQGRYFAYAAHPLGDSSRFVFMSGASTAHYQIPNVAGVAPSFTAFGQSDFDSSRLNENQVEHNLFNILAVQTKIGALDSQTSYFQRYSTLHFLPDQVGDILFNGIASNTARISLVNGIQNDNAYTLSDRQIIRFGSTFSAENAQALSNNTVLPLDGDGNPVDAPFSSFDGQSKTGLVGGLYVQDEYRLTRELTLNAGLRFDAINQYVTAEQLSPRVSLSYTPAAGTVFHAGYARYFTPPELSLSAPTNLDAFANTTAAPGVTQQSPVRPERSHYFDVGVTHQLTPALSVGLDGYYKIAKNLLDDGQFGQALVLTEFNYDHAFNDGVEFKFNYARGGLSAYGNIAVAQQQAKQVSSNQYLFDPDELAYIANNHIFTDHNQFITVSGGASYRYAPTKTTLTTDVIYGSGLRDGFANTGTVSPYATWNLGLLQDFQLSPAAKPTTFRFAVVNVLDHTYQIRDGSGIGVFLPQYGQRRGFYASLSQRF